LPRPTVLCGRQDGLLELEDALSKHIPAFADVKVRASGVQPSEVACTSLGKPAKQKQRGTPGACRARSAFFFAWLASRATG
jgi:hypothetical protein